ncbi:ribonuclease H-like domain-containing protein [Tanacetum coccineum]
MTGFSTGPKSRSTLWKQTVLYLEEVLLICEGESITGSMTMAQNKKNPGDVDITLSYSLNGDRTVRMSAFQSGGQMFKSHKEKTNLFVAMELHLHRLQAIKSFKGPSVFWQRVRIGFSSLSLRPDRVVTKSPSVSTTLTILAREFGSLSYDYEVHHQLTAFTDADWAGCLVTRRSTSGYCVFLGDNLLSWSDKRQVTLSRSSAEAKYRGVANVVAETTWILNLLLELHAPLTTATLVYFDNVSAVCLSTNPVQHQRTKHIEIDIHFF